MYHLRAFCKATIGLISFALFSGFVWAGDNNADKSLLWKISGNGLTKPSYLFGTIHLICGEDYVWTAAMDNSFRHSEKLCLEMNLADPGLMMEVATAMIDKSGKKLKDYFTPEQYEKLEAWFKKSTGMDLTPLQQMKPVLLQSMMLEKSSGCDEPIAYEDSLMKMAQRLKIELDGLELPAEQMSALDSIPADSVIADIMKAIDDTGANDQQYAAMVAAYKMQDLPGLYHIITDAGGIGGEMGPLLDNRNARWISRMQARFTKNSVFFAVGAGHLYGDKGLITLLRKQGYSVEAVN